MYKKCTCILKLHTSTIESLEELIVPLLHVHVSPLDECLST